MILQSTPAAETMHGADCEIIPHFYNLWASKIWK